MQEERKFKIMEDFQPKTVFGAIVEVMLNYFTKILANQTYLFWTPEAVNYIYPTLATIILNYPI